MTVEFELFAFELLDYFPQFVRALVILHLVLCHKKILSKKKADKKPCEKAF